MTTSRSNIESAYPLTPLQQGLLFHALHAPESAFYLRQTTRLLEGDLDQDAFARAWTKAIARHAVLRTAFEWERLNGKMLQIVLRTVDLPLDRFDWRGLDPGVQADRQQAYLREVRQRGCDLAKPPLMRLGLARVGPRAYRFMWTCHHVLLDGWSSTLLLNEVAALYAADLIGEPLALSEPRPFRDYIAWLQRQSPEAAEAYWRRALAGFTQPSALPLRPGVPAGAVDAGVRIERGHSLSRTQTVALADFARRMHVTLGTIAQTAWGLLLARYNGGDDVVFGVTVSGRPPELAGVETMLGLFINTLPLHVTIEPAERVGTLLGRVQKSHVEASQYGYASLVDIHGWSDLPPGARAFDSILVFENYPVDAFQREYRAGAASPEADAVGVRSGSAVDDVQATHYALVLLVNPGEELGLRLVYDPARMAGETVDALLRELAALLAAIPAHEHARADELQRVAARHERARLAATWGAAVPACPADALVHTAFERHAAATPDAVAVIDGERRLSYRELDERSTTLAHVLRSRGVRPDVRVGICVPPGEDLVIALLAVMKAGGGYVPFDPAYPRDRLSYVLKDAAPACLLSGAARLDWFDALSTPIIMMDAGCVGAARGASDPLPSDASPDNLAYVMYTSGSTGVPKGVVLTHACLANLLAWHREHLPGGARLLQYASLNFDVSFHEVFAALNTGAAVVVLPQEARADVSALAAAIHEHRVDKMTLPVLVLEELALAYSDRPEMLSSLRHVIATGEALRVSEAIAGLFRRLPHCRLHNHYGPSETHLATVYSMPASVDERPALPPIGRPITNARTYVLGRQGDPIPPSGSGELFIGGRTLARGYWARPDLTAERFVPDPFAGTPGARMYRTGDRVCLDERGELHFQGRLDRQVKIHGVRIEPGEIEVALAAHPAVRQAVVIDGGAGHDLHLIAYIVSSQPLTVEEVHGHLARRLPHAMLPRHVVLLDEVPRSPNGKVDRARLPVPAAERAYVEPATPASRVIAGVWEEVLNRPRAGADDHFFEHGGHSLRAMQATARLREVFGDDIPVRWMFDHPTPARFARALAELRGAAAIDRIAELWMGLDDTMDAELPAEHA